MTDLIIFIIGLIVVRVFVAVKERETEQIFKSNNNEKQNTDEVERPPRSPIVHHKYSDSQDTQHDNHPPPKRTLKEEFESWKSNIQAVDELRAILY